MIRDLDGYYFRAKRDGRWKNICFSDLTREEQEKVTNGKSAEWARSLAIGLNDTFRQLVEYLCEKFGWDYEAPISMVEKTRSRLDSYDSDNAENWKKLAYAQAKAISDLGNEFDLKREIPDD